LELSSLALFADAIVSSVSWASNSVADFPSLLTVRNSGDVANYFVAGNNWEAIPKSSILDARIRVADATGDGLDEDLAGGWLLEFEVFEDEGRVFLFEDGGFVYLWERSHVRDD